jgi:lycopene cyclase domain-containing protein
MFWNALGSSKIFQEKSMKNLTYLIVDLGALIVPLIFSFHPKVQFYKKWKSTALSIFIVGSIFIVWDILYTKIGVWGFNSDYLTGVYFFNLPIEEILFFICIPYACLYTYHCLKMVWPIKQSESTQWITYKLCIALFVSGLIFYAQLYTSVTFISIALTLFFIQIRYKPIWLSRLYTSFIILIIPFLIVNGILTGTGLESPIVWYNENEIIGLRILTIPIEDFFYGFLLILLNVILLEILDKKLAEKEN